MSSHWKWITELVLGSVIFVILYALGQSALAIPSCGPRAGVFLACSAAILALFMAWVRVFEKKFPRPMLGTGVAKNLSTGFLVGTAFFCVLVGVLTITGHYTGTYASPLRELILANLALNFYVACGEEIIFRGLIFRLLSQRIGLWWALGISTALFGLIHLGIPHSTLWSSIAIATEAGILLGAAYHHSGSLWLPIGIHWAWNFAEGNIFGFSVSGGDVEESIITATVSGPDILTGGAFGPEASILAVILGLIISTAFIRRGK